MKRLITPLAVMALILGVQAQAADDDRYFLFVGEPSPAGWTWLLENADSSDREQIARQGIEKLGGEMLSYYWGVNDAKNYITVRLPADSKTVPALLITRLSTGLLVSYEAIELMPSSQMPLVMKRIEEIAEVDDVQPGNQEGSE